MEKVPSRQCGIVTVGLGLTMDYLTFHMIDLGVDNRLTLIGAGYFNHGSAWLCACLHAVGQKVTRLGSNVQFDILATSPAPVPSGDTGAPMTVPSEFRWTIHRRNGVLATIEGAVDSRWRPTRAGAVAEYCYEGEFEGRPITGRAFLEYSAQE